MPSNSTAPKLEESEQDQPMSGNNSANDDDQLGEIEQFVEAPQTATKIRTKKYGNSDIAVDLKQAAKMPNSILYL